MHLYLVDCGVYNRFFVDKYVHNRGGYQFWYYWYMPQRPLRPIIYHIFKSFY
jgi:hypothetical protein